MLTNANVCHVCSVNATFSIRRSPPAQSESVERGRTAVGHGANAEAPPARLRPGRRFCNSGNFFTTRSDAAVSLCVCSHGNRGWVTLVPAASYDARTCTHVRCRYRCKVDANHTFVTIFFCLSENDKREAANNHLQVISINRHPPENLKMCCHGNRVFLCQHTDELVTEDWRMIQHSCFRSWWSCDQVALEAAFKMGT